MDRSSRKQGSLPNEKDYLRQAELLIIERYGVTTVPASELRRTKAALYRGLDFEAAQAPKAQAIQAQGVKGSIRSGWRDVCHKSCGDVCHKIPQNATTGGERKRGHAGAMPKPLAAASLASSSRSFCGPSC